MRFLHILMLGSVMVMIMEVESKPATFLVETADADADTDADIGEDHLYDMCGWNMRCRRVNKINI